MTTIEPAHDMITESTVDQPDRRSGHIGRITALTMTAGAVTALIFALVVFSGGTEPVITGTVLLAFAASWALFATLAERRTDQPQRWARVPAAVMAVLGIACLALRPTDAQMRVAGWVWPLGLVALAGWMIVQSRRSLRSWSRRGVLYPIFGLMIVGGIGAAYETVREARDEATYAAPGDLVDVGGRRLHINCTGTGAPTVVLEAGLGEPSTVMAGWIAPAVSPSTRVCVYDRAGKGWSDPAPEGADPLAVVTDLHTLLERHGETGPFVLAGHSSGGVYVQAYAATYPDDVAGLVLIDSQPRTALTDLPGYSGDYEALRKASGIAQPAARFGLIRIVSNMSSAGLPEPVRAQARAFGSTAGQARSMRDELVALPVVMERAQSLTTLGDKPVAIVTAEQDAMDGWLPLQAELTRLSTTSSHRSVPDATHSSLVEDEHDATSASRAILDVVQSVRTRSTHDATKASRAIVDVVQSVRTHSTLDATNASRAILDVVQSVRTNSTLDAPAGAGQGSTPVARPTKPTDELVDVDGARLHVRCSGSGAVTAVLIAGFETSGDIWDAVAPTVAQQTRVCIYDRYGTGSSDPAPASQTFVSQADDLRAALISLGEGGPYLVVGHSFGGSEAVTFAAQYRDEVMGLLLVDASPANWPTVICAVPNDGTPAATGYQQMCTTISTPANNVEHLDGLAAFDEVAKIETVGDLPMIVMTATQHPWGLGDAENARLNDAWETGQGNWLSLSSSARLVPVDNTGHNIQVDQPGAVVEQIQQLLR
jgi:pimeloyl-ACP methyl ester carboxylesterase